MLAGQYFSRLLCGEDLLPEARLASCAEALLALNFNAKFAVPPDEVSADLEHFSDFSWLPYVEAFGLTALALSRGAAVLPLWEKMMRSVERDGASVADTRLMYRPLSGAPAWGAYYMTAPASWLVYDALLDFSFMPEDEVLRLAPTLKGTFAVVHPLFWGVGSCDGTTTTLTFERVFRRNVIRIHFIELPRHIREISVCGSVIRPTLIRGAYAQFRIATLEVQSGLKLTWCATEPWK